MSKKTYYINNNGYPITQHDLEAEFQDDMRQEYGPELSVCGYRVPNPADILKKMCPDVYDYKVEQHRIKKRYKEVMLTSEDVSKMTGD